MKTAIYFVEALMLKMLYVLFRCVPLDVSSAIGGAIGRLVGPRVRAHRIALDNLRHAFPEKTEAERLAIARGMWDNLGRVMAEIANLPGTRLTSRMTVHGMENLPKSGESALFFSGHIGNWELAYPMAFDFGVPLTLIYRHANNPFADKMILKLRLSHASQLFPKGIKGATKLIRSIKEGSSVAMLVDQKMNTGIPIPFFGRDAMTAPAIAEMALRYNKPILPARIVRRGGAHFDGYVYPKLEFNRTGDDKADARAIMVQINAMMESWIREYPEQWFWVHKRWPT
jgi:KDO2-lipid IV(A) lauroyltransferase